MNNLFPEKPILVYPTLAASIGLEEATLLSLLDDMTRHKEGMLSQGMQWYHLSEKTLKTQISFWDARDIQRLSQRLRDLGLIHVRSAPFMQSLVIDFAFNLTGAGDSAHAAVPNHNRSQTNQNIRSQPTVRHSTPVMTGSGASIIAANWQPDSETLIGLGQLNIPEHFARDQVPEFVNYWRETGETQRSWGSKFIQHSKRQWIFHTTQMARQNRATTLPAGWQPSSDLQIQIANEGIPTTFSDKVLNKFRLYHQKSETTQLNWDMPFFSWVKDEWQKQDTPFIETKKSTSMTGNWRPNQHTLDYLNISYGIDAGFIADSVPEFIHKWTEKKAIYSEWGKVFAEHVIEQWRFVQAGVSRNPISRPIDRAWQPSDDCLEILSHQSEIDLNFIHAQLPEFILYWTNRGEARHSWDNIFLQHIKRQWAAIHAGSAAAKTGNNNERQQNTSGSGRTKDRTIAQQLNDTSWAS
ncbi:MAG: hypothetical protein ACI80S_000633 [Pseudohongiellaceae bacterium]|jgi:hypothetical protein